MGVKNNIFFGLKTSKCSLTFVLPSLMKRKAKQRMWEAHPNDFWVFPR